MISYELPAPSRQFTAQVARCHDTVHRIVRLYPNGIEGNHRLYIAAAFSSQAMEHFRAILILCESRVANGSAFTLLRPLVEAVVRGEWILRCATDPKFVGICNGTARFPKFQVMAVALDEHHVSCDYASGPYFAAFTEAFSALSGYTHTGVEQMAHRFQNDGAIGPTYPEKTITGLMNEAEKIVVRHFALFAQIRGFNDVATALLAPYDAASDS